MTKLLRNRRGAVPVTSAILVLVFAVILSVLMYVAYVQIQTMVIRNAMKTGLANLAVTISADTYAALRESDFEEYAAKLMGSSAYRQTLEDTYERDIREAVPLTTPDYSSTSIGLDFTRDGYTSDTVTFEFTVSAPNGVTETDLSNNSDSASKTVSDLPARACADIGFTTDVTNTPYTRTECGTLTWEVYEWNGGFVKKTYTAVLDTSAKLIPNVNAGYRVENSGIWTTRSGYGVDTEVTVDVESTSIALAGTPKVDSFYPEHNYSTAGNKSDRLELLAGKYVFQKNSTSVNDSRMHGVPLWFPDGTYAVKYYAYDVWCPMGMLTGYTKGTGILEVIQSVRLGFVPCRTRRVGVRYGD